MVRPVNSHTKHLTELERMRVRTLYYDAFKSKKEIERITGYTTSQIRTAISAKSAALPPRPGRPRKSAPLAVEAAESESKPILSAPEAPPEIADPSALLAYEPGPAGSAYQTAGPAFQQPVPTEPSFQPVPAQQTFQPMPPGQAFQPASTPSTESATPTEPNTPFATSVPTMPAFVAVNAVPAPNQTGEAAAPVVVEENTPHPEPPPQHGHHSVACDHPSAESPLGSGGIPAPRNPEPAPNESRWEEQSTAPSSPHSSSASAWPA